MLAPCDIAIIITKAIFPDGLIIVMSPLRSNACQCRFVHVPEFVRNACVLDFSAVVCNLEVHAQMSRSYNQM